MRSRTLWWCRHTARRNSLGFVQETLESIAQDQHSLCHLCLIGFGKFQQNKHGITLPDLGQRPFRKLIEGRQAEGRHRRAAEVSQHTLTFFNLSTKISFTVLRLTRVISGIWRSVGNWDFLVPIHDIKLQPSGSLEHSKIQPGFMGLKCWGSPVGQQVDCSQIKSLVHKSTMVSRGNDTPFLHRQEVNRCLPVNITTMLPFCNIFSISRRHRLISSESDFAVFGLWHVFPRA